SSSSKPVDRVHLSLELVGAVPTRGRPGSLTAPGRLKGRSHKLCANSCQPLDRVRVLTRIPDVDFGTCASHHLKEMSSNVPAGRLGSVLFFHFSFLDSLQGPDKIVSYSLSDG